MLKKRTIESKRTDSGIIPNNKLFPLKAAINDSKNLNKKILNNHLESKESNRIFSKLTNKSSSDINLLNKKIFFSNRNNKSKNDENKRNTFKIIKSFSQNKFLENVRPESKIRNFSQSPNLKKYSKLKSQLNLSEIFCLKKEKKSFDFENSNKLSRNRTFLHLNGIINDGESNFNNFDKQKGLSIARNFSDNLNKDSKNLNLLFNNKDKTNKANLFFIVKNKPENKKKELKLNNHSNEESLFEKNSRSDNNFKKFISNGLINKSNLSVFYETPAKKRISRSANLKNCFDKVNKNEKNSFQRILNDIKTHNLRPFNNTPYAENFYDDQSINIDKIKRRKKVLFDNSLNDKDSKENFMCRKLTLDDFLFNSAADKYNDKKINFSNVLQSEPSNLSFNSNFNLNKNNNSNINNGFANNPFILNNTNDVKKNISNLDYVKTKENNKEDNLINKNNICDNTNIKTNFKSHLSNNNSAFTFLNTQKKADNFPISFGTTNVKRNLNFNDILKTENKNSSKESLISRQSNNSKPLVNTSVISINQKSNNFLDFLNNRKEENKDLLENSSAKKSSSTFSDKFNLKSLSSASFSNTINIRTNFSDFFYSFKGDKIHKSQEENLNEIIMGDFNSIYEKINKNKFYFNGFGSTPNKFDNNFLAEENKECFSYLTKDSKNKLSSLNSSINLNISPKIPLKNLDDIEEDIEEIQVMNVNSNKNNFNKSNCEHFYEFDDVVMVQKNNLNEINEENKSVSSVNNLSNKSLNSHKSSEYQQNASFEAKNENLNVKINNKSFQSAQDKGNNFIENNFEKIDEIIKNDCDNFYNNFLGNLNSNSLISQNLIENINPITNCVSSNNFSNNAKGGLVSSNSPKINNENFNTNLKYYFNNSNEINHLNNYAEILRRDYIKEIFFDDQTNNNNDNINSINNFYNQQQATQIPINQTQNASFFSQSIPVFPSYENMLTSNLNNYPYINNPNSNNTNNNNNLFQNRSQELNNIYSNSINNNNNYNNINTEIYFLNQYINNSISNFNTNIVSQASQSTVNLNLPNSIYTSQISSNTANDLNNAYNDFQFSSTAISQDSTKMNSTAQSTGVIDKELFPYLFNHKLLPPGKENDEVFKAKLANMIKNPKLPVYHSDFVKKRTHSQMLGYNLIAVNLNNPQLIQTSVSNCLDNLNNFNAASLNVGNNKNINTSNNNNKYINDNIDGNCGNLNGNVLNDYALIANNIVFNQTLVTKNASNRQTLRICDEDPFDFSCGIPEYKFNKYRKISSCKTNYSSYISFFNYENKNVYFRIYRDDDLGFEEKYQKLTKIHEADNDVDTDDEQLDLAKEHVQDVLKSAIKNFDSRDLSRGIITK